MDHPMEENDGRQDPATSDADAALKRRLEDIVTTMTEMELGLRPISTLDTLASPLAARRIRQLVHGARMMGTGTRRARTAPTKVLSSCHKHPSAGVTEAVVVIACEQRARAYCVRLEQEGDRWRIVELARPDSGLRAAVTEASRTGSIPRGADGSPRSSGLDGVPFRSQPLPCDPVLPIDASDDARTGSTDGDVEGGTADDEG